MTTLDTNLLQAIGTAANGLKAALVQAQQTAAQATIQQTQAQGATDNAVRVQTALQSAPDACAAITRAAYSTTVTQNAGYQKNVTAYRGAAAAGNQPTPADQARNIQNTNYSTYCDPNTDPDRCASSPSPGGASNGSALNERMTGADERASTLFQGAGSPGHVANLTYTPTQQKAAQDYISNLVDGADAPRKLSDQEYKTPQGQQYEGLRIAYEARMSLARDALEYTLASRTPMSGSAQIVQSMMTADGGSSANYINSRLNDPKNGILLYSPSGDVSPMQLLDLEVGRRTDNPDWYTMINTSSDTNALLREQVFMTAQLMKMELIRLKGEELRTALAGLAASESTKTNMKPKMDAAAQAVASGMAQTH